MNAPKVAAYVGVGALLVLLCSAVAIAVMLVWETI